MAARMVPMFDQVFRNQNRVTLTAAAMRGLLAREDYKHVQPEMIAEHAVALADAALAKLGRTLSS